MSPSQIAFRLLVAAAWSDGELHPSEALLLGQYLGRLDLPQEEQRQLLEYLQLRPADDTARVWLAEVGEVAAQSGRARELELSLRLIIAADGRLAAEEERLAAELRTALAAAREPQTLLGRFKRWLRRLTGREAA